MRAICWAATVIAAVVLTLFAISNRSAVTLGLWPLPFLIDLPLYLLVFAALFGGFAVGAVAVWLGGRRRRREFRRRGRRIEALERELAATQARLESPAKSGPARLPTGG
jgi:putative membrane protein